MNSLALVLVLVSALVHATWNLLIKKSAGGNLFLWMFASLSSSVLVPAAVVLSVLQSRSYDLQQLGFIAGTSLVHLLYFFLLQRGYKSGDLSVVYPLARGLGPALSTAAAILLLRERPTPLAIMGLLLIVSGIVLLTVRRGARVGHARAGVVYGVLTGIVIAFYTVWDKYAVDRLAVPPLVLEAFTGLGISITLTPTAMRNWPLVRSIWSQSKREVLGVAILAPLSYILVLTAMTIAPLSYVAPCREISILFAALLAARFLGEQLSVRRMAAAGMMVTGVVALALG